MLFLVIVVSFVMGGILSAMFEKRVTYLLHLVFVFMLLNSIMIMALVELEIDGIMYLIYSAVAILSSVLGAFVRYLNADAKA